MGNQVSVRIIPDVNELNCDKRFTLGIIDVQNDFINGSLAVDKAIEILGPINKLRFMFFCYLPTFISQDFHPENHMSFAKTHGAELYTKKQLNIKMEDGNHIVVQQDMWPVHCVKESYGAKFHDDLIITNSDKIFQKGTKANVESYSAFGDEFKGKYEKTELENWLKSIEATDIILTGLATDFCVYNTALDAIRLGYKVHLIMSCTRGVKEETTKKAIEDMTKKGVTLYDSVDKFYEIYRDDIIYSTQIRR